MWVSRTKADLIIEVWEKLDCESVGAAEIEAIEVAVASRFGEAAVESPMRIARLLADEGAALRHSELMELWVKRFADQPHEAEFRNLITVNDLASAARSMRQIENLRKKFLASGDKEGLRLLREEVIDAKTEASRAARSRKSNSNQREIKGEIVQWLTVWLQTPDIFEQWAQMRKRSDDFKTKFGGEAGE